MTIAETIDRRILGAIQFIDATTGQPVTSQLLVDSGGAVRLMRNSSGYYVAVGSPGMSAVTTSFNAPSDGAAAPKNFVLIVTDPDGRYVKRKLTIQLPRSAVAPVGTAAAVGQAVVVPLFPSVSAATSPGWAILRGTVLQKDSANVLPGALVRVLKQGSADVLARALADQRGQALVAVPGLPVTTWNDASSGAVLTSTVAVTIETVFDPSRPAVPDPGALDAKPAGMKVSSVNMNLVSGRSQTVQLFVDLA